MKLEITHKTNDVNVTRLQETVRNVKASPELARFKFCLENRWIHCGETHSAVQPFFGCEQTFPHKTNFTLSSDEPDILLGQDTAANPVEHLLHALAACVTTSLVYHAAARGIVVEQVESTLEGDLDLRGFLGLDPAVRNGYQQIRLKLRIKADLTNEQLRELSALGPTFSPVFDSVSRGVPISVSTERIS